MPSASDVAKVFLTLVDSDSGDVMTNLKLQKLLYYAQGFYLAMYDKPLFPESIEKWMHGPVVPEVYREYKTFGSGPIPAPAEVPKLGASALALINDVWNVYGQYTASALRNFTHQESPWLQTADTEQISKDAMRVYFKTRLVNAPSKQATR